MGKKKSDQPKAATSRKKRLRLVDTSPVELTAEQQRELRELYRPLSHATGSLPKMEDYKRIAMDRMLYIYVESLCHDASLQAGSAGRRSIASLRRRVFLDMNKLCGRELSPADIIKELSKQAPVPAFAANAIRRDYLRVSV
jgi:hypothetical protein